jgi:Hemerythrin HHE cation binding domain
MATEAVSPDPMRFASTKSDAAPLAAARRHRAELLQAIQSFERSLAVPAGDPAWRDRVAARLGALRAAFAEHVVVTEGADGLYAEVLNHAPRLSRAVHVLIREHAALAAAMDALQRQVSVGRPSIEEVRGWASDLLRELSRHRQRGADLVYEAYATDIGGET